MPVLCPTRLSPSWATSAPRAHEPRWPHIVDLAGGRGQLIYTFMRRHTDPQIVVTEAFWA